MTHIPFNRAEVIDGDVEAQIMRSIADIEREHDVRILHAAESGSRAWGFHSPNSDYDVRFFYIRPRDWYLSIYPGRDVIELPIDETYDVSGWDLKKTLHLAMKSNAVVMEWLQSPIVYKTDADFTRALSEYCAHCFNPKALMHHYLNLGKRQIDQTWRTSTEAPIKKYFYMIRPAMALRWLMINGHDALVPMNIQDLMDGADVSPDIRDTLNDLIGQKRRMQEKAPTKRINVLDTFIFEAFEAAEKAVAEMPNPDAPDVARADAFFRSWLTD